jgi:hypothetical protein
MKSVSVIAKALESLGVIGDAEECLGGYGHRRFFE